MLLNRRSFLQLATQSLAAGFFANRTLFARASKAHRIHIGAQTNTWGAPIKSYDHLLEILDKLVHLGYQGFETNYLSLDPQADHASEVRKAFSSRQIQFIAPHADVALWAREDISAEIEKLHRIAIYSA